MPHPDTLAIARASRAKRSRPKRIPFTALTQAAVARSGAPRTISADPSDKHMALAFLAGEATAATHRYVRTATLGPAIGVDPRIQAGRMHDALAEAHRTAEALSAALGREPAP